MAERAVVLGEEMQRCMRELSVLQTEGLEAELLGPRYPWGRNDRRQMPNKSADERTSRGRPDNWMPPDISVTPATLHRRERKQMPRQETIEDDDEEEEEEEEEENEEEYDRPEGGGVWDMVAKFFNVGSIQSPDRVRELIYSAMNSAGSLVGKMDERVLEIFNTLTEKVLAEALPVVKHLKREPLKRRQNMRQYGFALLIVNEYLKLAGLHAHVRRDMETFVDFYDLTLADKSEARRGEKYLRFNECCARVADESDQPLFMNIKMTLRSISIEIARKMLLMATHLVELIVVLEWYQKGRR
jgi:hypothetical protein